MNRVRFLCDAFAMQTVISVRLLRDFCDISFEDSVLPARSLRAFRAVSAGGLRNLPGAVCDRPGQSPARIWPDAGQIWPESGLNLARFLLDFIRKIIWFDFIYIF